MTFTIPFDREKRIKYSRINFQSSWKKPLWLYRTLAVVTAFLFMYSLIYPSVNGASDAEMFFVIMLTVTVVCFSIYFKSKKHYNRVLYNYWDNPQA